MSKKELKVLLAEGKTDQVIKNLMSHFSQNEIDEAYDSTVLCSSSYYNLKNRILQNLDTQEFYILEQKRITKTLIGIINNFYSLDC